MTPISKAVATQDDDETPEAKKVKRKNVAVINEGDQIILPDGMEEDEGIEWLKRSRDAKNREFALSYEVDGWHPVDALVAFHRALNEIFGFTDSVPTPGFFGPQPPVFISVHTGPDEVTQVPWGAIRIPSLSGLLATGMVTNPVPKLIIQGRYLAKHRAKVDAIMDMTRKMLRERSIYKGQAIRVSWEWHREGEDYNPTEHCPKFMKLDGIDPRELIFSDQVMQQIDIGLFSPIRNSQAFRDNGIPLKRGILLEGPYGTGKTLTARMTAKLAVEHRWTFVYMDSILDLGDALRFAGQYTPCVIFAEDIDRVLQGERTIDIDEKLNLLDGVDTKDREILTVLTTNNVHEIIKPAIRPGRIDTIASLRAPDAAAAARLVELYGRGLLSPTINLQEVGKRLEGKIPAFNREAVERAKIAAINRLGGSDIKGHVNEADIYMAVEQLRLHEALLEEKTEEVKAKLLFTVSRKARTDGEVELVHQ